MTQNSDEETRQNKKKQKHVQALNLFQRCGRKAKGNERSQRKTNLEVSIYGSWLKPTRPVRFFYDFFW